jgi:hypothetical protein
MTRGGRRARNRRRRAARRASRRVSRASNRERRRNNVHPSRTAADEDRRQTSAARDSGRGQGRGPTWARGSGPAATALSPSPVLHRSGFLASSLSQQTRTARHRNPRRAGSPTASPFRHTDDRTDPAHRGLRLHLRSVAAADERQRLLLRARRTAVPGDQPPRGDRRAEQALPRPHRDRTAHRSGQPRRVHRLFDSAVPRRQEHLAPGPRQRRRDRRGGDRDRSPGAAGDRSTAPSRPAPARPAGPVEVGTSLLVVGFPLGFHDTLHHMPVVRHAVLASSFGLRFKGQGYFLTDARTHRGTSGAPVVMRAGRAHCRRLATCRGCCSACIRPASTSGGRDLKLDEALGLNCAWYADILLTLTEN